MCIALQLGTDGLRAQVVKLKSFSKFENTTEALAAATAMVDGKMSKGIPLSRVQGVRSPGEPPATHARLKAACTISALLADLELVRLAGLKKFLKKSAQGEELAVLDSKLGGIIKEKLGIPCVYR